MNSITVLVVEDDDIDILAFKKYMQATEQPWQCRFAKSVTEAKQVMDAYSVDIIISDYHLQDGTGMDVLAMVKTPPVILITGRGDEHIAINAMKNGAYDYLTKDRERTYLHALPLVMEKAIKLKRAEREAAMMAQAFRSIGDIVYIADADDRLIYVNRAFCETYGYSEDEIIGQPVDIFLAPVPLESGDAMEDIVTEGLQGNFCQRRKDGSTFPATITLSVLHDEEGVKKAVVGVIHNMTEHKRAEAEKLTRRKMEGVIEMAGAACHELNQPMQAVSGYAELLKLSVPEDDPACEMADEIKRETARMAEITRKLNSITRYATVDYLAGKKIIDIDRAAGNTGGERSPGISGPEETEAG